MSRFRLLVLSLVAVLIMGAAPAFADDEVELEEPETTEEEEGEKLGKGALFIAALLHHHFGDFVFGELENDEDGEDKKLLEGLELGFGDQFKLHLFLAAGGDPSLIAAACTEEGECEFDWGELFKDLDLPGDYKNLGQMISEARRGENRPAHAASNDKNGEPGGHGKGKGK
jgi:hypothetical protein